MSRKTINALVHKGKDICLKKREKKLTCIKIQKKIQMYKHVLVHEYDTSKKVIVSWNVREI